MLICGIDDAGRGAVLGPLVLAGVLIERKKIDLIVGLGVKDSKKVSPKKRRELSSIIKNSVKKYYLVKLSPAKVDKFVLRRKVLHKLNRLEAIAMAEIIQELKPDVAYVDASDVNPVRFGHHIETLTDQKYRIVSSICRFTILGVIPSCLQRFQKRGNMGGLPRANDDLPTG